MNRIKTGISESFFKLLKNGDEKAFTELVHAYTDKLYKLSRKMSLTHEDTEEVCQEVFLKLWEIREQFDENESLNSFIFTIAKNIVLQKIRKRYYLTAVEKYWEISTPNSSRNSEEELELKELIKYSEEFIDRLPIKQKKIVLLRLNEHLNNDEIAARLGISKRTVENQIYRSLKKLRHFISP